MRTLFLCLAGAAAGIMAFNVVAPAADVALMRAAAPAGATVDRTAKSDHRGGTLVATDKKIVATVEVIGLDQAAVVYRDREGHILFSTDPLQNTTVVVRGVALPQVTVRSWTAETLRPMTLESKKPVPPAAPQPTGRDEKLPIGCEPASSQLSPSGSSAMRARCVASLIPTRVASVAR